MTEVNQDTLAIIRRTLALSADGVMEALAAQHDVPLLTVTECLPSHLWRSAPGNAFVDAMHDIAGWGEVTFIVHTPDVIAEFCGPVPDGKLGRGFYNLQGGHAGLTGHLRPERCARIVFVQRPFMKLPTASVQFFNVDGGCMFKVYIGRDENKQLRADQLARFDALSARLTTSPERRS